MYGERIYAVPTRKTFVLLRPLRALFYLLNLFCFVFNSPCVVWAKQNRPWKQDLKKKKPNKYFVTIKPGTESAYRKSEVPVNCRFYVLMKKLTKCKGHSHYTFPLIHRLAFFIATINRRRGDKNTTARRCCVRPFCFASLVYYVS